MGQVRTQVTIVNRADEVLSAKGIIPADHTIHHLDSTANNKADKA
jgi:hypothetical protein